MFIDRFSRGGDALEEEANHFARDILIPPSDFNRFIARGNFTQAAVEDFAGLIGIEPGIVVNRLQQDGDISPGDLNDLKTRL